DRSALERVASTVLADSSWNSGKLAPLVVDAVLSLPSADRLDLKNFSVERALGGSVEDSFFVRGVAMPHELADPTGPRSVNGARIALVRGEINERKPERGKADTKILISEVGGISSLGEARYRFLTSLAQNVTQSGANVLFIEKGIDPIAIEYLSRRGILVVRRFVVEGFERLAAVTGARTVYDVSALSSADLGFAETVETRMINGKEWLFVEGCRNPKAATFIVRGDNDTIMHSTARVVLRSLKTVKEAQRSRTLVYGGGAWEMSLARRARNLSTRCEGRQQLAIDVFADALEAIPLTLAQNAGMDGLSTMADLVARHAGGEFRVGIDSRARRLADMGLLGVLDPFSVKRQVLLTAFGVGAMLIRIDNMILYHELFGEARTMKEMEKYSDPERIEKRRKEYGGMEKLERPRYRPKAKEIRTLHP
ncbi:MAG: TCP-1/cpn60 chaperonin family protein, partial [Thaumarchaeota archaeon]|nr:TCP-1/cpn60 chaperonin family protein [Nitrososphaerota archaeon]